MNAEDLASQGIRRGGAISAATCAGLAVVFLGLGDWLEAAVCAAGAGLALGALVLWERNREAVPWLLGTGLSLLFGMSAVQERSAVLVAQGGLAVLVVFFVGHPRVRIAPLAGTLLVGLGGAVLVAAEDGPPPDWRTELPRALSFVPTLLGVVLSFEWIRGGMLRTARRAHHEAANANRARTRLLSEMGAEVVEAAARADSACRALIDSGSGDAAALTAAGRRVTALVTQFAELSEPHRVEQVDLRELCAVGGPGVTLCGSGPGPWVTTDRPVLARLFEHLRGEHAGGDVDVTLTEARSASGERRVALIVEGRPTAGGEAPDAEYHRLLASQLAALLGACVVRERGVGAPSSRVELFDLRGPPRTRGYAQWRLAAVLQAVKGIAVLAAWSVAPLWIVGQRPDAAVAAAVAAIFASLGVALRRRWPTATFLAIAATMGVYSVAAALIPSPTYLVHVAVVGSAGVLLGGRKSLWPTLLLSGISTAVAVVGLAETLPAVDSSAVDEVVRALVVLGELAVLAWSAQEGRARALGAATREIQAAADSARRQRALVSAVGHELRTPLNALLGEAQAAQLADRSVASGAAATRLERSTLTLLVLIDQALALAQGQALTPPGEPTPVLLSAVVEDVVSAAAHGRKGGPVLESASPADAWVAVDEVRLREILGLLIRHLRGRTAGAITVAATSAPAPHGRVAVQFLLVGAGGGPPEPSLLLTVARELAGSIDATVEDAAGQVHLLLVLDAARPPGPMTAPRGPVRVLVVDDTPFNVVVLTRLLEKLGAEVVSTTCGAAAIVSATSTAFDLVLMDLQMPELDGCATARELRARGVVAPIVGVTASANAGTQSECLAAGMQDCIAKPVRLAQLEALVEAAGRAAARAPRRPPLASKRAWW